MGKTTETAAVAMRQPPTREEVLRQMRRLGSVVKFPPDPLAAEEFVKAFGGASWNDEHLRSTVDCLIETVKDGRLTIADVHRIAYEKRPADAGIPAGCERCGGTGFVSLDKDGLSYAKPCECRAGETA
jgi:predicted nucleic acid-binding protein